MTTTYVPRNMTQRERVIHKLNKDGFVTRNECLRQFPAITRLSAIIQVLEDEGWQFYTEDFRGDYKYYVKDKPVKQNKLEI